MARRPVQEETSSAGCLITGIAGLVLPPLVFVLLAWPFGLFGYDVVLQVFITTGCVLALVFALILGFLGDSLVDGALKIACLSPCLWLPQYGDPWLAVGGVALFSAALAVFVMRLIPKT